MTSSTPPPSEGSPSAAAPTRCTNCGAVLQGPWCSTCGQKVSSLDPTWHDLIHDSIHEFLHLDGKIFRSARTLFCEPGELTAELLRGRRARYIGPLRLYLTFSVMFFLLTAIVPNPNPDQELAGAPRAAQEVARANYVAETFAGLAPKLVFILVPVFALLLKLAYWRHRRHYPQFLVLRPPLPRGGVRLPRDYRTPSGAPVGVVATGSAGVCDGRCIRLFVRRPEAGVRRQPETHSAQGVRGGRELCRGADHRHCQFDCGALALSSKASARRRRS